MLIQEQTMLIQEQRSEIWPGMRRSDGCDLSAEHDIPLADYNL